MSEVRSLATVTSVIMEPPMAVVRVESSRDAYISNPHQRYHPRELDATSGAAGFRPSGARCALQLNSLTRQKLRLIAHKAGTELPLLVWSVRYGADLVTQARGSHAVSECKGLYRC